MEYCKFIESLIIAAGQYTLYYRSNLRSLAVQEKNNTVRDLVSEADREVERFIREQIHNYFPQHRIVGEELGSSEGSEDFCWLIDPIDGTANFLKGFPYYSVSIALQKNGENLAGAVYGPALCDAGGALNIFGSSGDSSWGGQLYMAKKGTGASMTQVQASSQLAPPGSDWEPENYVQNYSLGEWQRLQVRPLERLAEAILVTGFGCVRQGIQPDNYLYLGYILPQVSDVRRLGSAALDICSVAAGVFDGFWEIGLNLYDITAACLILEEAGGCYSDLYGTLEDYPSSLLVAGPLLHGPLVELLAKADKPHNGFRSLLAQAKNEQSQKSGASPE